MKDKINAILLNSEWTLERFAQELNVPVELVSSWVNDDVKPDPSIQVVIDDLYNTMIKCMEEWMRAPYKMRYIIIDLNRLLDAKEAENNGYYTRLQAHLHEIQDSLVDAIPDNLSAALGTTVHLMTLERVEAKDWLGFFFYYPLEKRPLGVISAHTLYEVIYHLSENKEKIETIVKRVEKLLEELDKDIYTAFIKIKECCVISEEDMSTLHQDSYYEEYLILKENNVEEYNKLPKRILQALEIYEWGKNSFKDLGIINANYIERFGGHETLFLISTPFTYPALRFVKARDIMFRCLIEGHPWEHYYPEYRERINKIRRDNNDIIYD